MTLSTHKVEVVRLLDFFEHPNADTLQGVSVFGGYPCLIKRGQYQPGDLAAYIPPDSVVDVTRPEFSFLAKGEKTKHRIRTIKLRGIQSYGLLVPAPPGAKEGDDVAEYYGVEHYEPEMRSACTGGEAESPPAGLAWVSKYDIDNIRRYRDVFAAGEPVLVTEKIHGANSRYCYMDGRMWCGSRSEWKREDPASLWWKVLANNPSIEEFCKRFPGCILYGEAYGDVQNLRYGCQKGEYRFAAFDVLRPNGSFSNAFTARDVLELSGVPQVPSPPNHLWNH